MDAIEVTRIREHPELAGRAAAWFAEKWGIPAEAYADSLHVCLAQREMIPQWYLVLDAGGKIIGGAGVIENDFHDRKDLSPNLCALFVEGAHRGQQIARSILEFVRRDLGRLGYKKVYLVTDHTSFYEKCGWKFLTMVTDDEGVPERMYVADTRSMEE